MSHFNSTRASLSAHVLTMGLNQFHRARFHAVDNFIVGAISPPCCGMCVTHAPKSPPAVFIREFTDANEHENCTPLLRSEGHVALVYELITPPGLSASAGAAWPWRCQRPQRLGSLQRLAIKRPAARVAKKMTKFSMPGAGRAAVAHASVSQSQSTLVGLKSGSPLGESALARRL